MNNRFTDLVKLAILNLQQIKIAAAAAAAAKEWFKTMNNCFSDGSTNFRQNNFLACPNSKPFITA